MRLQKVKTLISEGKTQQAIDLLQEVLKDKDNQLLNQTFLLEGQYKELVKKMQLGLQDATSELNRINFTLLSVCDDASNLANIGADGEEKPFSDDEKPTGLLANPLAIFGIIAAVAIAIVVGFVVLVSKTDNKTTRETPTLPIKSPQELPPSVKELELPWQAMPTSATILAHDYGDVKMDVLSIKTTEKDANTKILNINIKFTCLKSDAGSCIVNYLDYRLVSSSNDKDAPTEDILFDDNLKTETAITKTVSFVIPNNQKQANLEIYYRDKKAATLTTIRLIGH